MSNSSVLISRFARDHFAGRRAAAGLFAAWFLVLGAAHFSAAVGCAAERKPNIVVFLVDDMGWMDCGAYGSKYYETPNMDRLATRGMRFTDAYSANPLCSPTRASILTGKYPARHGITTPSGHLPPHPPGFAFLADKAPPNKPMIEPESRHFLDPSEYTLAEALHDAGYRTAHFGKWHLGLTEPHWPDKQGFDVAWHGKPDPGPPSYFSPYGFKAYQSFPDGPPGEYITDRLTTEALKFIEENRERPFLLDMWQYGVHGPWGHKEEYTKQFVDKQDPRGKQGNPIMASMLKSVDESLGRLVAKLDELGITDNTIIIFTSDNGGNVHSNTEDDSKTERRQQTKDDKLADWRKWAGNQPPTNNAPLASGKSWLFEGGIRVPLMIVWPGVVKAASTCATPVCSIDFYPTVLQMVGISPQPQQIIDGQSLVPLLTGSGTWHREALFNFFPHSAGNKPAGATVRVGDWKLIRWWSPTQQHPEPFELYNLRDDLGETRNLATAMPDKVKELDALIDGFLKDTGALYPKPNPAYQPASSAAAKAKAKVDDPLQGWKARQCKAVITDGALRIEAEGALPFLGTSQLKVAGPAIVKMRARTATGGASKIEWRTEDQETFPKTGQTVTYQLQPSGDWQTVAIELPVKGQLVHFRVYLPASGSPIEIQS
ncbi:MAG TPA: sulfatase, partial [Pirellulales bacterium]|nr:sulfatase [Pirellulales bacterium]